MLRVRFILDLPQGESDYRPVVWPVKHPYWCSGYQGDRPIIISYADDVEYIYQLWPEATDLEVQERKDYIFTDRFPKPEWFEVKEGTFPR